MGTRYPLLPIVACLAFIQTPGQAQERARGGGGSIDLMVGDYGIAIGDNPRVNGLRINFRDEELRQVNGINFTIWQPRQEVGGSVNGLALGLVAPSADYLRGISVGLGAVVAERSTYGLGVGGLAVVSQGDALGVSLGGLAVVAQGDVIGANVGGLATVSEGRARGLSVGGLALVTEDGIDGIGAGGLATVSQGGARGLAAGGLAVVAEGPLQGLALGGLAVVGGEVVDGVSGAGLAVVSQGRIRGAAAAGLAVVADDDVQWLALSGLATVAGGNLRGLSVSGLATVADGDVSGVALGGLAVVSGAGSVRGFAGTLGRLDAEDDLAGIGFAGYRVRARDGYGLVAAGAWTDLRDLRGLAIAPYNRVQGLQMGLTIGVYNSARELHGVQLGLLNHAGNNRAPFRWLPFVNAHF